MYELHASGRVVVASIRAGVGAKLTLTNVDLPLDLGEESARYQAYAVLPRGFAHGGRCRSSKVLTEARRQRITG